MDELGALIHKLTGEVAALEAAVDSRQADEDRLLNVQEARLKAAQGRATLAQSLLRTDALALTGLDQRRTELLKRIESWRGQLWRIGHGGAVMALVTAALVPIPALITWLGSSWALGLAAMQAALFAFVFFVTPEKR